MKRFETFSKAELYHLIVYTIFLIILLIIPRFLDKRQRRLFEIWFAGIFLTLRLVLNVVAVLMDDKIENITVLPLNVCTFSSVIEALTFFYINNPIVKRYFYILCFFAPVPAIAALTNVDTVDTFITAFSYLWGHVFIFYFPLYLLIYKDYKVPKDYIGNVFIGLFWYSFIILIFDHITGANFVFMRHPPASKTVVEALGVFPFYNFAFIGIGIIVFPLQYYAFIIITGCARFGKRIVFGNTKLAES